MKIVVISDCDSRKITLVNNLQGYEIAQELLHPSSLHSKVYSRGMLLLRVIVTNCALDLLYIIIVCVCMHACAVGAEAIGVQATQLIGEN